MHPLIYRGESFFNTSLAVDFVFFFLINNEVYWEGPKHTKVYSGQINHNVQSSINSETEWIEKDPKPITQSNKMWKKNSLRSGIDRSESSKRRELRSAHLHQTKQCGIIFQTKRELCCPLCLSQVQNRSITVQGITQCTPNIPNTMDHSSIATEQCRNRWSTLSPLRLHIQHHSWIMRPRFRRLSIVRTFPKVTVQDKKATRGGTLTFQMGFQGNDIEEGSWLCALRLEPQLSTFIFFKSISKLRPYWMSHV